MEAACGRKPGSDLRKLLHIQWRQGFPSVHHERKIEDMFDISGSTSTDLSRSDLLDTVGVLTRTQRRVEVEVLRSAAQWAVLNGERPMTREERRAAGVRVREYGGPGTPRVAVNAGAELGVRLEATTWTGDQMIADVLDLQHRHPQLWARVEACEVRASYATYVVRKTRELSLVAARYVDERVVESADGRLPWTRFMDLVEAAIAAADPELAEEREHKAAKAEFARASRDTTHGMRSFWLRTDPAGVARLEATVAFLATVLAELGCEGGLDQHRAAAMVLLANPAHATALLARYAAWKQGSATRAASEDPVSPDDLVRDAVELFARFGGVADGAKPTFDWSRLLPAITLFVHVYAGRLTRAAGLDETGATGMARIEGVGLVTEGWIRDRLGPRAKVTVRPVMDLDGQAPVDAWEIPDRHRQAVRLMTPADAFPWSTASTNSDGGWSGMQIDHTEAWRPDAGPGQSRIGNYGPLTQRHHNLKTHAGWQVKQPFAGIYVWRDPEGAYYLVDHTGTRRVGP